MVCQPFKFRHQGAQIVRPWRRLHLRRCLDAVGKCDTVGDGAIARRTGGKPRCTFDWRTRHQRLDPLVHIAEALFAPHHRFTRSGEAEMSRLDDAGMYRANGNLMQAFAFHRQERVNRAYIRGRQTWAEWIFDVPKSKIEPRTLVRRANRLESVEAVNGALEPNGRRMQRTDRRERFVRTFETHNRDDFAV